MIALKLLVFYFLFSEFAIITKRYFVHIPLFE